MAHDRREAQSAGSLRRNKVRDQKYESLGREMDSRMDSDMEVPEAGK